MENYQLTILINNKVDEKGRSGLIDDVKKDFGKLIKEDLWGVRTLAYEIKHMDKAFYAYFEFESEPKAVLTLDKNIRLNEDIIRYLLVRMKAPKRINPAKAKKAEVKTEDAKVESKEEEVVAEKEEVKSTKKVVKINSRKKA